MTVVFTEMMQAELSIGRNWNSGAKTEEFISTHQDRKAIPMVKEISRHRQIGKQYFRNDDIKD